MPNTSTTENKSSTTTSIAIPIEQLDPCESTARAAPLTPFVPINEETVFLDADPVTSSGNSIFRGLNFNPLGQKLDENVFVQNIGENHR